MFSNSIAAYQKIGKEAEILGADPHRLIVLLFDGAEAALNQAQDSLGERDIKRRSDAVIKAIDIISTGLASSLNLEEGGELAHNLKALYDYMVSRLIFANIHQDARAISEVQKLLGEIAGAWREIGDNMKNQRTQVSANP